MHSTFNQFVLWVFSHLVALAVQALMPVAVFIVGCAFGTEKYNGGTLVNMLIVSLGVAIASYGKLSDC